MFEPLSDVIRLRRKQLNLTQEKLAQMAKVSRRQLSLLEDGHNVSLLFLTKIADALELDELPVGRLRLFTAPPELGPLVRAAEAVQMLKQASDPLKDATEAIAHSVSTLDALIAKATAPRLSTEAIDDAADRLANLPASDAKAAAETLRMLASSDTARAERPESTSEAGGEFADDAAVRRR